MLNINLTTKIFFTINYLVEIDRQEEKNDFTKLIHKPYTKSIAEIYMHI